MLDPTELFPEIPNLYEFLSIHADMIYDERRVRAYKRAIDRTVSRGDTVVDVGTGTGILAFLCLQAGASHVHAVDRSPVIRWAERLASANGFANRITFHQKDSRDLEIAERVDVIVSELIGHIAFEEGMVETISDARKRFLKPRGSVIPLSVALNAVPVCEQAVYDTCIDSWKPAYGIDYAVLRDHAVDSCYISEISESELLSEPQAVFSIDFAQAGELETTCTRVYAIRRSGLLNGVAFWFDASLSDHVRLSSGPWSKTHWKQCFKPLRSPLRVVTGDFVQVAFGMKLQSHDREDFGLSIVLRKDGAIAS